MEDRNELSDIVLEKEDNKVLKIKRILIIAALLILIFLVALVVMKVINNPAEQNRNSKLILPPEPKANNVEPKKEDNLFKQVPITQDDDKKESFEDMVKSLKEKEIKKQEKIQAVKEIAKTEAVIQEVKKVEPKKVAKVTETPKTVLTPKIEEKVIQTTVDKDSGTSATKGVYIQVGATSRLTPDKKFLAAITAKNYTYRLLKIQVKDKEVTKILIGPYANTTAAKNIINDIKTNINKDAFIYRVK